LRLHRRFVIEADKDLTSPDLPLWQEPVDLIRYLLLVSLALTLRQHRLSV
jgi:hypothetical protein